MIAALPIIMSDERRPWWFVLFTAAAMLLAALAIDAGIVIVQTGAATWREVANSFLWSLQADPLVQSLFIVQVNVVVFAAWYLRFRRR